MTDIFQTDTPKLEDYMGEGKKYSDGTAVAKALNEKDTFIQRLLDEKRQLEADLRAKENLQAYNDRIAALEAAQVGRVEPTSQITAPPAPPAPAGLDEAAVQRILEQREAANKRSRNLIEVQSKLVETFGNDYPNRVKAKAQELGIDMGRLNEMAAETPTAFYALIGLTAAPRSAENVAPPANQHNSAAQVPQVGKKNNAYYSNLRKTKPAEYWTPRVQMEEFNELKRQGQAFYEP